MAGLAISAAASASNAQPVFDIKKPTIVAFFVRGDRADMANSNMDDEESLADFQHSATQVAEPLRKSGIEFRETYSSSFRIRVDKASVVFRPTEIKVGYYFVAPGKKPRVEYGVLTDSDLLKIASQYFGISQ